MASNYKDILIDSSIETDGEYFVPSRKGRILGKLAFKSPYRAADDIMKKCKVDNWLVMAKNGYRVVGLPKNCLIDGRIQ